MLVGDVIQERDTFSSKKEMVDGEMNRLMRIPVLTTLGGPWSSRQWRSLSSFDQRTDPDMFRHLLKTVCTKAHDLHTVFVKASLEHTGVDPVDN